MVKPTMVHGYHGILPANKMEKTFDTLNNLDESQRIILGVGDGGGRANSKR